MYNNSYINPTINSAYKLALLHEKKVIINFFNVGHGSCTHIVTPNNKNFLIDVGTNENRSIIEYLKYTKKSKKNEKGNDEESTMDESIENIIKLKNIIEEDNNVIDYEVDFD